MIYVPSHGRLKATRQTKNFNLQNDRKDSPNIRDLTDSQFSKIFLHQSVDKLRAGCISQQASDQLKIEVLTSLHDIPVIRKRC